MDLVLGWIGVLLQYTWWFWLLLILMPAAHDAWIAWRQKKFEHDIQWSFLEMQVPRETLKSPQGMEQILNQLYYLKNYPGDLKEYWWDGEVTLWHSFEIVSLNGEIHFYIKTPKAYRDLVEAAVYAFYPDVELVEAEDYLKNYAPTIQGLYADGYSLYGSELKLKKSGAYPIRNYTEFESPDENKQYDPISTFTELLAKLKPGQMAAIQFLCQPVAGGHDEHEVNHYREEIIKLRERKHEVGHGGGHATAHTKAEFPGGVMPALAVEAGHVEDDTVGTLKKAVLSRTPRETAVIEAIEENLARPMYNVTIRYIYISKTEIYNNHFPRRAMAGAFNQFGTSDLNSVTRNKNTSVSGKIWEWPVLFPQIRRERRRQRIYYDFRHREVQAHTFFGHILLRAGFQVKDRDGWRLKPEWYSQHSHMNTRSIATLFHPPTYGTLTGPHIKRVDSRKGGPPAGMAIFGEEDAIDKFK